VCVIFGAATRRVNLGIWEGGGGGGSRETVRELDWVGDGGTHQLIYKT
jgi:hypothetical protein